MQFDPTIMQQLLAQSDGQLWETIRRIAAMNNIHLPSAPPSPEDLNRLRGAMRGSSQADFQKAMHILQEYRSKAGK